MPETAEQLRSSDGRFAKPNPEPGDTSPAAVKDSSQDHAQASVNEDQDYAAIWKDIQDRTADAPASPDSHASSSEPPVKPLAPSPALPASAAPAESDAGAAEPTPKDEAKPTTPAEPAGFALIDYDGSMSANERALLKSVKFLPPAAQWRGMSEEDRLNLLDGARNLRNHQNRQFNQRNNPPAGQPASIQPQPQRQPPAAVAGSFGQSQAAGQAAATQLPPDVAQHLQQVAAEFGEESSIFKSQLAMAQRYEEQLQRLSATTSQFQQQQQMQQQDLAVRAVEDSAAEKLAAKFPQLSDPVNRDKAREAGRQWLQMLAEQGRVDFNDQTLPQKVMEFGAAFHFSQENQQSTKANRDAARTRSLSNTFDRERPKPPTQSAPNNEDEAMAKIFKGISAAHSEGKSGQEAVRKALQSVG